MNTIKKVARVSQKRELLSPSQIAKVYLLRNEKGKTVRSIAGRMGVKMSSVRVALKTIPRYLYVRPGDTPPRRKKYIQAAIIIRQRVTRKYKREERKNKSWISTILDSIKRVFTHKATPMLRV